MTHSFLSAKRHHAGLGIGCLLCSFVGCGLDVAQVASQIENIKQKSQISSPATLVEPTALDGVEAPVEQLVSAPATEPTYSPPYPSRTNPFEFAIEVAFDGATNTSASDRKLTLFGFVGSNAPKAIIHLGNETQTLSVGDNWGTIEVLAIEPPEVRLRFDGVVRTWSLLGDGSAHH
ncbi:MAG: hypothetical protein R3C53_18235 [Pirellulaceae bacterium]